jgi:hypothetical protein
MGWKNALSVMWWMPKDLSPGERCVVNAIAWGVSDASGDGPIGPEKMRTWSGMTDGGLTSALQRLAERGFELRVPIGTITKDGPKKGQPLYAVPGKCRRYRLPADWRKEPPVPVDNYEGRLASEPTYEGEGWPASQPRLASEPPKVGQPASPRGLRGSKSQSVRAALEFVCEFYGVTEDDGLEIWQRIQTTALGPIRSPLRYARRCIEEDPEKWRPAPAAPAAGSRQRYDPACPYGCRFGFIEHLDADGRETRPPEICRCTNSAATG